MSGINIKSKDKDPQKAVKKAPPAPKPQDQYYNPALANIRQPFSWRRIWKESPAIMVSLGVHGTLLIFLALWYMPSLVNFIPDLRANLEELQPLEDVEMFEEEEPPELNLEDTDNVVSMSADIAAMESDIEVERPKLEVATSAVGEPTMMEGLITQPGIAGGTEFGGRNKPGRAAGDGSEGSEAAVARALRWIAAHQLPDGSWSYSQMKNPNCRGKCKDIAVDSANPSRMSATAMALLPFLGGGITHREGKYKREVLDGINWMTHHCQVKPGQGILLLENVKEKHSYQLYHHGLATIVVCEAAAMTRDKQLAKVAEGAVQYIVYAQDPTGGGWRYVPKQAGDTSAMGWNFMALKSAQMAYLPVPPKTVQGAKHFLDYVVASDGGARYGYTNNTPGSKALTSIGLLGQMYLGWKANDPRLVRGTDYIAKWGTDLNDLYYMYYATQVMHHVGGENWQRWNRATRDPLVAKQVVDKDSHEYGSWAMDRSHVGTTAGRLGSTAFTAMILEVYYRHLPLYRKASTTEAFSIE